MTPCPSRCRHRDKRDADIVLSATCKTEELMPDAIPPPPRLTRPRRRKYPSRHPFLSSTISPELDRRSRRFLPKRPQSTPMLLQSPHQPEEQQPERGAAAEGAGAAAEGAGAAARGAGSVLGEVLAGAAAVFGFGASLRARSRCGCARRSAGYAGSRIQPRRGAFVRRRSVRAVFSGRGIGGRGRHVEQRHRRRIDAR
jgi:hypothetical protein